MSDILKSMQTILDHIKAIELEDILFFLKQNVRSMLIIGGIIGIYYLMKKPYGLPPGPRWTLPIVGDLLSISDKSDEGDPRLPLRRLRKKYGDIYSVYFGPKLFIVINGYPMMKDALVKNGDIFSDRPNTYLTHKISQGNGIINSSGKVWKDQRKFALETLREFGFGKNIMEDKIHQELEVLVECIQQKKGVQFDFCRLIQSAVSNVISSLIFGQRFDYNDEKFLDFLQRAEQNLKVVGANQVVNIWPILRLIPGDPFKFNRTMENVDVTINTIFKPSIEEHFKYYDENNTNDFISCFIKEMKMKGTNDDDTTFNNANLIINIGDLFIAGTETTSTALLWSILYCLHYPKVYQRCSDEVQEIVGTGRMPSVKDKPNMPYIEAFSMEILRVANIAVIGVPHAPAQDTKYQGYYIPKDAIIIPNLDSVLYSDEIWGDADKFRPERFLDSNGQVIHREEWIPFSLGRRVCLGEALAKMEMFLFFTTLLQRFHFQPVDPNNIPPLKGEFGVTHAPLKYEVRLIPK